MNFFIPFEISANDTRFLKSIPNKRNNIFKILLENTSNQFVLSLIQNHGENIAVFQYSLVFSNNFYILTITDNGCCKINRGAVDFDGVRKIT